MMHRIFINPNGSDYIAAEFRFSTENWVNEYFVKANVYDINLSEKDVPIWIDIDGVPKTINGVKIVDYTLRRYIR